jgi:hypothetical protein
MTRLKRHARIAMLILSGLTIFVFALVVGVKTMFALGPNRTLAQVLPPNIDELIEESAGDMGKLQSLILSQSDGRYALRIEEMNVFLEIGDDGELWLRVPVMFESDLYNVAQHCWRRWGRSWNGFLFYKLPGQWWRFGSQVCAR